jgi:GNAT superfamily N-acetyltransferase
MSTSRILVRPLDQADAPACDAVIRTLPDYFGHEGGLAACAEAVRTQRGWVAAEDGRALGFATWERRTDETAEVTWMAVERGRRHEGIGTAIIEAVAKDLSARGYLLALALTSAAGKDGHDPDDIYEATRRFWKARGFLPLIALDIWDTNLALLMVRPLEGAAPSGHGGGR